VPVPPSETPLETHSETPPETLGTSVVVPAFNAAATLGRQLEALAAQQTTAPFEVLVVDNASTDSTAAVAASYADRVPALRVVAAHDAAGVAYARNAGARAARGSLVLFCDADDEVRPGWVEALVQALAQADLVGGSVDVTRINDAATVAGVYTPRPDRLPSAMGYLPYAIGANLGVRRATWESLGGFDETYVGGHEEVDFAWRVQEAGGSLAFVPEAVVDYRLRANLRAAMRQQFWYGSSYAQLYSRFSRSPIPRARVRHEVKVVGRFLAGGPRALLQRRREWLNGLAWNLGRWRGGLTYRVRPPL
jgi:GT2 family glycosyltransferase